MSNYISVISFRKLGILTVVKEQESITGGVAKDKEESQFITTSVQLESSNIISTT